MGKPKKPQQDPKSSGKKPSTSPEQAREAREAAEAREAQASIRDRMVDIGRGENQAGRQKGD